MLGLNNMISSGLVLNGLHCGAGDKLSDEHKALLQVKVGEKIKYTPQKIADLKDDKKVDDKLVTKLGTKSGDIKLTALGDTDLVIAADATSPTHFTVGGIKISENNAVLTNPNNVAGGITIIPTKEKDFFKEVAKIIQEKFEASAALKDQAFTDIDKEGTILIEKDAVKSGTLESFKKPEVLGAMLLTGIIFGVGAWFFKPAPSITPSDEAAAAA